MRQQAKRYPADLTRTTAIRLSEDLRDSAERAASDAGITFSAFVRQSIRRNLVVFADIEKRVAEQSFRRVLGK